MENLKLEKYQVYHKNYTILDSRKLKASASELEDNCLLACLLFWGKRGESEDGGWLIRKERYRKQKIFKKKIFLTLLTALTYKEFSKLTLHP